MNLTIIFGDPELLASPEVGGHLRAVDEVFGWETGNIWARTADVFPLDESNPFPLLAQGPGKVLTGFTTSQYQDLIVIYSGLTLFLGLIQENFLPE